MKVGDYVKVKDGIELDNGELSKNWAGKITVIEGEFITIEKDAQTINGLSDNYIRYGYDNGLAEYIYVFEESDLELSERRDTDKMYQTAVKKYDARYEIIDNDMLVEQYEDLDEEDFVGMFDNEEELKDVYFAAMKMLAEQFFKSSFAEKIADIDEDNASFTIEMFVNYAMNYREEMMEDWTKGTIDEICLDIIPRKVSMEAERFEVVGKVLKHYFDFLEHEKLIKKQLGNYVYSKRKAIYNNSQNSANWGMAKSMLMGATEQNIDINDEDSLRSYLDSQMFKPMTIPEHEYNRYQEPAKKDTLKNIGRNDKVSVKYTDGKVLKDVKFKKVMKDVKNGKCELI